MRNFNSTKERTFVFTDNNGQSYRSPGFEKWRKTEGLKIGKGNWDSKGIKIALHNYRTGMHNHQVSLQDLNQFQYASENFS